MFKKSAVLTIGISLKGFIGSGASSPVMKPDAIAVTATSTNLLSLG